MTKKGAYLFGAVLCALIGLAGVAGGIILLVLDVFSDFVGILFFAGGFFLLGAGLCYLFYNDEKKLEALYSKDALKSKHSSEKKATARFWRFFVIVFPILFAIFWFLFPILFGTADDRDTCRMDGCTLPAASSGDSVYCVLHSNRCVYCGCYIDADASVCMDCIEDALGD